MDNKFDGYKNLCGALGEFIIEFGKVESLLYVRLTVESRYTPGQAKIAFDRPTYQSMKTELNKHLKLQGRTLDQHADSALIQLGKIAALRNDLVHCSLNMIIENQTYIVPNSGRRNQLNTQYKVSVDDITAATSDLKQISVEMLQVLISQTPMDDQSQEFWKTFARSPWSYRQPRPSPQA